MINKLSNNSINSITNQLNELSNAIKELRPTNDEFLNKNDEWLSVAEFCKKYEFLGPSTLKTLIREYPQIFEGCYKVGDKSTRIKWSKVRIRTKGILEFFENGMGHGVVRLTQTRYCQFRDEILKKATINENK